MDLQPLGAEAVVDRPGLARLVPVAEELLVEVQGEIGIDADLQGVVLGEAEEQIQLFLVDPLLGDRRPAARRGRIHGVGRRFEVVVVAVPDPVGVGIDEPGIGDVLTDVDDRHLLTGERQDLVSSPDRGHRSVLDEQGFGDGRLVHRHDPADEDEAPGSAARSWRPRWALTELLADEGGGELCCSERNH